MPISKVSSFLDSFTQKYSIDLGTANTLICDSSGKVILDQPSIVAVSTNHMNPKDMVCVVGTEAKSMVGKTPGRIKTVRPLKEGVIADFHLTEKMLQHFLSLVHTNAIFKPRPVVVICVPCGSTQVERRAIKESAYGAGARYVRCIDEPLAAALGANLPIDGPSGNMIVDIGGGTTEIAIISLNGIVYAQSVRIGGDAFDEAIITYVRRKYGCLIGEATAERVKLSIATAFPVSEDLEMEISGRLISEGVPRSFILRSSEVLEALTEPLTGIVTAIRAALEQVPPELSSDINHRGMVLSGGGALLHNIDRLISEEVGLPVVIADEPKTCVVRGGAKLLEQYDEVTANLLTED
ncbi:MAG: rod shape-determining protein [Pseudomonadota bacterium]|nr:rod shape-determining protein [Pseudomonadota bacterium]